MIARMAKKPRPPHRVQFGKRLSAARMAAGYDTMREFADALGIEEARYRRWEAGEAEPDILHLTKISKITRVSLDILVSGKRPAPEAA